MAKVKAPLFSFGASGKIADALVYFPWKGLNVVRSWVKPSNPKSTDQVTQRGYVTACVAAIHTAQGLAADALDEDDKNAYAALASTFATPRTWFNAIVKLWIDCKRLSDVPIVYSNGQCSDKDATDALLDLVINEETGAQLAAGKFFYGTSKTALINSIAGVVDPGVDVDLTDAAGISGLVVGTKYYWQFRPDAADPCEGADSGIYDFVAT